MAPPAAPSMRGHRMAHRAQVSAETSVHRSASDLSEMQGKAGLVLVGAALLLPLACGGSSTAAGTSALPPTPTTSRHTGQNEPGLPDSKPNPGSSDGVTCEQVRDQYVEEIDMQGGGPADLTASDFGAILNQGTYLSPCNVPADSKVTICAAIKNGSAVGVTVALEPPSPEIEVCVSSQVRALSFPSHPKMDFVKVRF
jgi:hypothetical protein